MNMARFTTAEAIAAASDAVSRELHCEVTASKARAWRSVTFTGINFELDVTTEIPADLEEREFSMSGWFMADIAEVRPGTIGGLMVKE